MCSCAKSFWVAGTGPIPITRGATPAEATPATRALIVSPNRPAIRSEAMIMAAAPSLIPGRIASCDGAPRAERRLELG